MKKYDHKMMEAGREPKPKALVCLRECVCPGVGNFQEGDVVTDPEKVQALLQSPYFKAQKEGE